MSLDLDFDYIRFTTAMSTMTDSHLEALAEDIRILLARRKALQEPTIKPKREVVNRREVAGITYQLEMVRCGKKSCETCPHGPYWYSYQREGKKVKSKYVGKEIPPGLM